MLKGIHDRSIIHQDLKPHNIMRSQEGKLYIIDFGLARVLSESKSSYCLRGFIGTPRYASVRAHNMFEQSKKDDLESLFYNIAYLFYEKLPWSKLHIASEGKLEKIKLLKVKHRETLFEEMPFPFQKAFDYITGLRPNEDPDYSYIKGLFKRNKTVLLEGKGNGCEERSNTKRASLNLSNFLQVPHVIHDQLSRLQHIKDLSTTSPSKSNKSLGLASDVILSHYLSMEEENCCESEGEEGTLPDVSKYLQNTILKNPFH